MARNMKRACSTTGICSTPCIHPAAWHVDQPTPTYPATTHLSQMSAAMHLDGYIPSDVRQPAFLSSPQLRGPAVFPTRKVLQFPSIPNVVRGVHWIRAACGSSTPKRISHSVRSPGQQGGDPTCPGFAQPILGHAHWLHVPFITTIGRSNGMITGERTIKLTICREHTNHIHCVCDCSQIIEAAQPEHANRWCDTLV